MLIYYLKMALRNMKRQKVNSIINISGLAVGTACCILLFLFVYDEWNYDTFHTNADRISRVVRVNLKDNGESSKLAVLPPAAGPALRVSYPEIEHVVRMTWGAGPLLHEGRKYRPTAWCVDPGFLSVFTFPALHGNAETALQDPYSIVLTRKMASSIFGKENPIGKTLVMDMGAQKFDLQVTAVIGEIPNNSTIHFEALIPIEFLRVADGEERLTSWNAATNITFIQTRSKEQTRSLQEKLNGSLPENFLFRAQPDALELQPLRDIHLNPELRGGLQTSNPLYSYILGSIAFLILLLACVNFVNLSVGHSATRIKEFGLRKIIGAERFQLIKQLLFEAGLMSVAALILGCVLAEMALPSFNEMAAKNLTLWGSSNQLPFFAFGVAILLINLIFGSYPAFLLTKVTPVASLKKTLSFTGNNQLSRSLIIFQFGIAIFLLASVATMSRQMDYLGNMNLGLNKENIVQLSTGEKYDVFRDALLIHPGIVDVTSARGMYTGGGVTLGTELKDGSVIWMRAMFVASNFVEMMGIELLAGRNFIKGSAGDMKSAVIINETFAKDFGLTVGQKLPSLQNLENPEIIGVVKDFNFRSLHHPIQPLILSYSSGGVALAKISPDNVPRTLSFIKETWHQIKPDEAFSYRFLDEQLNQRYLAEERWRRIAFNASTLAIALSSVGLLGLTLLTVTRRTKEIGIRKVLGASVGSIVRLLSQDFVKLVLLANVIAWPIVWYAMDKWLQNFAYRVEIGWWVFVLAGGLALVIALLTVSTQAVRAALANPVESLKYE